jgi:hypothetical protein
MTNPFGNINEEGIDADKQSIEARQAAMLMSFLDLTARLDKEGVTITDISDFSVGMSNLICDQMRNNPKRDSYRSTMVERLESVLSRHLL